MKESFTPHLIALCFSALLSACGGSSSSPPSAESAAINATLQGKAAKGIIIGGNVVANELNADGTVKNANVGSATTDATGRYSLQTNGSYEGGPIEIAVTAGDDTLMVCDATTGCGNASDSTLDTNGNTSVDFGEKYKPSSLNMTAMLPDAADGEIIDMQITPFTHMAAKRARAQAAAAGGSLNALTVAQANSAISNLLGGVNILRTQPVDITDLASLSSADVSAIAYAALSAAIAELADDDETTGEPDLDTELDDLSREFEDGTISATLLGSIVTKAEDSLSQTMTTDTSGVLTGMQTKVSEATDDSITPVASESAGDGNIDKAYAFISDLRTWGTVIGNEVNSPALAFETQIELTDKVYDSVNGSISDGVNAAFDAVTNVLDGIQTSTDLTQHTVFGGSFTSGTVSKTENAGGDTYTVSNAVFEPTLNSSNPATVNMVINAPRSGTVIGPDAVTFGVQSLTANDSAATLNVTSGDIILDLAEAYTLPDSTTPSPVTPDIESIAFDLQASLTEDQTVDSTGTPVVAADPVTFTGVIKFTVYPVQDTNGEVLDGLPGSFQLTGTVANTTGDSVDANFTASLTNAATLSPTNAPLAIGSTYAANNGGEHLVYWQYTGDIFTAVGPDGSLTATFNTDGSVTVVNTSILGISGTDPGPYSSIQQWVELNSFRFPTFFEPVFVAGQGTYEQGFSSSPVDFSADGFISFGLVDSEVNFNLDAEPAKIGLQFTAQLSGLPEATFSITGDKAAALDTGAANVTISYGTRSITFDASTAPATDPAFSDGTGTLTITNSDGVQLALAVDATGSATGDTVSGSVTIDGITIADISNEGGFTKVTYNDGTFEIF